MSELHVQVDELSPVVRRLQIEVPADRVSQVTDAVYARLGRTVKLKGYRQGHVPRRVLEKYFADQVKTDVAREIVDQTFHEALGQSQILPVGSPVLEPQDVRLGEAFSYSARVEVRPEVKLEKYLGLEIQLDERKVADADVDRQIEQLREAMATLTPVEDRSEVQFGDHASLTYEMTFLGTERPPQKREDALIKVDAGKFLDGHGEPLAGAKVGETREWTEEFGSEDVIDELKGKSAKIQATVTGIKRRDLPPLDDELAKDVGGAESLEGLRAKIRGDLEKQAAEENSQARRQALLEKLIEANPLEVPPALVDNMASRMAQDFIENLGRRGLQLDQNSPLLEQFKRDMHPKAVFEAKGYFLLDAVAKAEGLLVTAEEIEAHFQEVASHQHLPVERVRAVYRSREARAGLESNLTREKALKRVEETATVTALPKESGEPAGA